MQAPAELLKKFYDMGQKNEKEQDLASALRCYKWAAERGCLDSQLALGKMHEEGKGTPVNVEEAFKCYKQVADKRVIITAYFKVGCAYFHGEKAGTPQNFILAREYLKKIPTGILPSPGQLILGIIYYYGHGIKANKKTAHDCFWNAIANHKTSDGIENQTMAHAFLGVSYLDEACGEKSLYEANKNIYMALTINPITNPPTLKLMEIVENAIAQLDIVDHFHLIELLLGKRYSTNLPCPVEPTYTFSEKSGYQFSFYTEALFKKLESKKTLTQEEQTIEKELIAYKKRITILSPEQALILAIEELKKPEMRKNFLTRFLSISKDDQAGAGLYYSGLCTMANYIDGEKGSDLIQESANKKKFPEALEFVKLYSPPDQGSNQVEILLQAGKKAQEKGIYRIAKFLYNSARKLIPSPDKGNLKKYHQHSAVLEITLGNVVAAKNHFNALWKMNPDDTEIRYQAMELYTRNGHIDEAMQLLIENKNLLKRISQESTEINTWQQTLYGIYAFSEAENLFNKNDMKQGIQHVRSAATTGYMPAKLKLALCYLEGWGVDRNLQGAWQCFHAIKTDPTAAYYLGILSVCKTGPDMTEKKLQDYFKDFSSELITDYLAKCTSAAGLIELGDKAFERKMYRIATLHYLAAGEKESGNTKALLKRALCHIKWTEWNIALEMIKDVLQKEPSNQEAILAKLECLTQQHALDEAIALLKNNQSLYVSAIASCQDKRSWQKTLCLAFEQTKPAQAPLPVYTEKPVELPSAKPVIKKSLKTKRQKNLKPKSIQLWVETIFSCTTIDQFMKVFYDICKQSINPEAELVEKLTGWVNDHPQFKIDILQKLQEQPDNYEKYIDAWKVIPLEQTVITPVHAKTVFDNKPSESTPVNSVEVYPQLPEEQDKKIITITPIEKTIRRKNADRLHAIEPLMACFSKLSWCIKNQINNKTALFGNDLTQFETWVKLLQDPKNYQLLCDTYTWFITTRKDLALSSTFATNFENMQSSMSGIHQMITELELQLSQLQELINTPAQWKVKCETEFAQQGEHLKQLKDILNNFQVIRKKMNDILKRKAVGCIFAPRPKEIDELFEMLGEVSEECLLTGSVVRKIHDNEVEVRDTDFDFVLCGADPQKLIALGFCKVPHLNNMNVYSKKIWFQDYGLIPVDLFCIRAAKNWLEEDALLRALKRELYQDLYGKILDISGEAFFHLDNNIIAIPGNPAKRVQQDPVLLLRVVDDVLRILQKNAKPTIEENTLTAMKTWIKEAAFPLPTDHINAVARKYKAKWGSAIFVKKLEEYGLLKRMFDITHEGDWEQTAAIFDKQVAKKQVAPTLPLDAAPYLGTLGLFSQDACSPSINEPMHPELNLQSKPS